MSAGSARTLSLLLRLAAVACAVLAVAAPGGTESVQPPRTTIFVLDVSSSIAPETRDRAVAAIRSATARAPASERFAVVAFGGAARWIAGDLKDVIVQNLEELDPHHSNLEAGLARAASLSPSEGTARVVVLTDGRVDRVAGGVDLWVPLRSRWEDDVVALDLEVPDMVRAGEAFDAVMRVWSGSDVQAIAQLVIDDQPIVENQPVALKAGRETLVRFRNLQGPALERQGLHTLRAYVRHEDPRPSNNMAAACLYVRSKPRALVVEGTPGDRRPFDVVLAGQGMEVEVTPAAELGALADELPEFEVIVLSMTDTSGLSDSSIERLDRAVRDGAGLLLAARKSNAMDGFPDRLDALLPVRWKRESDDPTPPGPEPVGPNPTVDPKRLKYEAPPISLLLVIDTSGSMSGENLLLAKEACLATAETLSTKDVIGVIGFHAKSYVIVPFTRSHRRRFIEQRVRSAIATGYTDIHKALVSARNMIRERTESIRHIILLSDGLTGPANWAPVLNDLKSNGITVTTVCVGVGAGFDARLMSTIASKTGGRFIFSADFKSVPQIFTRETRRVILKLEEISRPPDAVEPPEETDPPKEPPRAGDGSSDPVETPRRVTRGDPHEATRGIVRFPDVWGMIPAEPRATAVVALRGGTLPLLASWRLGLGEVAVWTSDFEGSWGRNWRGTPEAAQLIAQLARSLSRSTEGPEPRPMVRGPDPDGTFTFRIEAGAGDETLRAQVLSPEPREIDLAAASASALEGRFRPDRSNTPYRLRILQGERAAQFGVIESYPVELRVMDADESFFDPSRTVELEDLQTVWDFPRPPLPVPRPLLPVLLLAAAVLLLADVGARRLAER